MPEKFLSIFNINYSVPQNKSLYCRIFDNALLSIAILSEKHQIHKHSLINPLSIIQVDEI